MKLKKFFKRTALTVAVIIAVILVAGGAVWLIDGRSPQAILVTHALPKATMDDYLKEKREKTDKSVVEIPEGVEFPREMRQYKVGVMQVFHMEPQDATKPVVLYIHGGAYVNNFTSRHWMAMAEWSKKTGCGIVAPNYPMLYRYTAADAHPLMMQLYRQLAGQYTAKRIIVMGDSAGGGFSLALAQKARNDSVDTPRRLVLISPWVDVLGGNDSLREKDTFLNAEVLRKIGEDWAGDIDPRDPMISPYYGDMHGLPPTDLFVGTWEIFYDDVVNTYEKMRATGVDARLHVDEKMGHVYPLWPCPEGSSARKAIAEIISSTD